MFPKNFESGTLSAVAIAWAVLAFFTIEIYALGGGTFDGVYGSTLIIAICGIVLGGVVAVGAIRIKEIDNRYSSPRNNLDVLNQVKSDLKAIEVVRYFEAHHNAGHSLADWRERLVLERIERKEAGKPVDQLDAQIEDINALGRLLITLRPH